jgi:hypoxanthine-DNA glycosylase
MSSQNPEQLGRASRTTRIQRASRRRSSSTSNLKAESSAAQMDCVDSSLQGLAPIAAADARLLILGSFPSAKSLQAQQYYANPRNQFWALLGSVLDESLVPLAYPQRIVRLKQRGVALWDTIVACDRPGSLDADIRNAASADVKTIRALAPTLACVAFNGARAASAARIWQAAGFTTLALPSSSPAHTQAFAAKLARWRALAPYVRPL